MEDRVRGEEGETLALGLGYEHAVEWVLMEQRQLTDGEGVANIDLHGAEALVNQQIDCGFRREFEAQQTQCGLDGDLPDRSGAERDLLVDERTAGGAAKLGRVV
jgi:hypothetical protein